MRAAGAVRGWLSAFNEPERRLLAASLHFGTESRKTGAYDSNPVKIVWTAGEVLQNAFPELDQSLVQRFFSTFGGAGRSDPAPLPSEHLAAWFRDRMLQLGQQADSQYTHRRRYKSRWNGAWKEVTGPTAPAWRLDEAFILWEPEGRSVLASAGVLTAWDCRQMARLLDLEAPPLAVLSNWEAAAGRVYRLRDGTASVSPIWEALRETSVPPEALAPAEPASPPSRSSADPVKLNAEQRIEASLSQLRSLGVAPTRRLVPGRYYFFPAAKLLGRVGEDQAVEVEPAWPVGMCTWSQPGGRGTDRYEDLLTGVTPSGRVVPMTRATAGDKNVDMLYSRWKRGEDPLSRGATLHPENIASALESIIANAL